MNPTVPATADSLAPDAIDTSCRVPLLALFGGAAFWLAVGLFLALLASIKFHASAFLAECPCLTYGRLQPAADDAIVYGFAIPAALGVILWIFARLSRAELSLPLVPAVAAHLWHFGVFLGLAGIIAGDSTGFLWLEFPRFATPLLFAAFLLIAFSAVATFSQRQDRELYPSHWFLLAALLWFPWIYSTANLFLFAWPVRGLAQAVIAWWYAGNLLFVWFALVGLGVAFYFLPRLSGRPLQSRFYAEFTFWSLTLFGTWVGVPLGAPVPAWIPTLSSAATIMLIVPLITVAVIYCKTVTGVKSECRGGPFCQIKFGTIAFVVSGVLLILSGNSWLTHLTRFTWFNVGQVQWQIFAFLAVILFGAFYEIAPRIMSTSLPFPGFVRVQHWFVVGGACILTLSLVVSGIQQGLHDYAFDSTIPALQMSTLGIFFLLIGSLLFLANVYSMTFRWLFGLGKVLFGAFKAPLDNELPAAEVKP